MPYTPVLNVNDLTAYVSKVFPEANHYHWRVEKLAPGEIDLSMDIEPANLRPGGTVSGPTMFALADLTAYMLILGHIGEVALAVTTSLNINFLNKPEPAGLHATGKLVKLGKRLAVCEMHIYSGKENLLVAQATATYSIPPKKQ